MSDTAISLAQKQKYIINTNEIKSLRALKINFIQQLNRVDEERTEL